MLRAGDAEAHGDGQIGQPLNGLHSAGNVGKRLPLSRDADPCQQVHETATQAHDAPQAVLRRRGSNQEAEAEAVALGEFLLASKSEPPMRSMLVFVPRIPTRLWQPYERTAEPAPANEELPHAVE